MIGSGRRRSSKWDLKEDTSPENQRSNEDGSTFIEPESRDNMSGTGDLLRSDGLKEESIPGFEGDRHYETRNSTGLHGGRHESRTHSSKGRDRSYRSRSRSRSRSPVHNPRRQLSKNDPSSRSGHSAPLCKDFSAGRCRQGDRCHFVHHSNSGRHLDKRFSSDRDDKALQSYSDSYSTGKRCTNICKDFLKGGCRRGASCKFPHHESGSDEHRKGTVDDSCQDHNEHALTEKKKSPDDWQQKSKLNNMHELPGDANWSNKTSPQSMPKVQDWDEEIVRADAPGDYNVSSYADVTVSSNIPGQGIHQLDESFSSLPVTCVTDVLQFQATYPLNPTDVGINEMPYHQASEFTQQSDHICDSIETKIDSTRDQLMSILAIPSSSAIPTSVVIGDISISDFVIGFPGDELGKHNLDPDHQGLVNEEEENEGEAGKGRNEVQEQGIVAEMAINGGDNDGKKGKEVKEMRPFKFALAETVKELLNPAWKEGKMSKEVYKTIVKKVVDKVTDSIQEAHIPGTKEKIDQYLSFSKPKLTKLVQAYLERYKKN